MRPTNRFARGSGCYKCRICGHQTRSTGRGDNELVLLCEDCYDLGGEENHLSDTGKLYRSPKAVLEMIADVARRGDASAWDELKVAAGRALSKKLVSEAAHAAGHECPECGSRVTESNNSTEYRCVNCDHRWGYDCGERYGF